MITKNLSATHLRRIGVHALTMLAVFVCASAGTARAQETQSTSAIELASETPPPEAVYQAGIPPQPGQPRPSGASGDAANATQHTADSETEKEKLAVNPVTGLAVLSHEGYVPLTAQERWKLYWKQNYFSVGAYFGPAVTSLLLDQTRNNPYQWGGGFEGYGRRLASRTANAMVQGTVQALAAPVLHEDVRFVPSGHGGTGYRVWHAIAYSFLTYNNSGRTTPNIANLGAYFVATAVTATWVPHQDSLAHYTVTNTGYQIALIMPVNVLQEFWPDIMRKLHGH
jgi:hypothetical protein